MFIKIWRYKFVIKCNHGSGFKIIVKNKTQVNLSKIKSKLNNWMKNKYAFMAGLELHYRDIDPLAIIEKYMELEI